MCTHYEAVDRTACERVARRLAHGDDPALAAPADLPSAVDHAYPRRVSPLLVACEDDVAVLDLTWGFEVPGHTDLVFNTRIESAAAGKRLWARSLKEGRAVACARAFYETHRTETAIDPSTRKPKKVPYRFAPADGGLLLFAALHENGRYSILTEGARESVAPVHPRMPLMLSGEEASLWLEGELLRFLDISRTLPLLTARPTMAASPIIEQPTLF